MYNYTEGKLDTVTKVFLCISMTSPYDIQGAATVAPDMLKVLAILSAATV